MRYNIRRIYELVLDKCGECFNIELNGLYMVEVKYNLHSKNGIIVPKGRHEVELICLEKV